MSDRFRVDREQLLAGFRTVGLERGDVVYVAASLKALGTNQDPVSDVLWALKQAVGEEGTLVMPAFHFGFCQGEIFDRETTPSTAGLLSERFRQSSGVLRSSAPPYHSCCCWGKRAEDLAAVSSVTSFGADSLMDRLVQLGARQVLIGCGYQAGVVHYHWLEEKREVPYRYWKKFQGTVRRDGLDARETYFMFARMEHSELNADPAGDLMEQAGLVATATVGLCRLRSFLLQDFADFSLPLIQEDPLVLLNETSRQRHSPHCGPSFTLDHVGLVSRYASKFRQLFEAMNWPLRHEGEVPSLGIRVQYHGRHSPHLEIVDPTRAESAVSRFHATSRSSPLHHLAFEVPDLEAALAYLKSRGYESLDGQVHLGPRLGERVAFLSPFYTGGLRVELVERG